MKEIIKCSISGVAFTMDTDAYEALKEYLDKLKSSYKNTPDGAEIVADIEARIAELILSAQDNSHVVAKPIVLNIIAQMGSPEDISEQLANEASACGEPRFPRRLYRDTENAKLSGVCAGIGRYFDTDPVWVRLGLFMPLFLTAFSCIPGMHWMASTMGNLFGIFVLCYLIMWFAVPVARTARQKLEMTGERITASSIRETTEACNDVDSRTKPIVAEAVSVFGKIVLVCLKIVLGFIVFGLIMVACALIIGLLAVAIGGNEVFNLVLPSVWVPILGIFVALIPTVMLIYAFMCLIASRKPNGKVILVIFLLWLTTIIACTCLSIREHYFGGMQRGTMIMRQFMQSEVVIDGDTTNVSKLLRDEDMEAVIDGDDDIKTLQIIVPEKNINITVDRNTASVTVTDTPSSTP